MTSPQITRELPKPPKEAPSLDPALFKPNSVENEFLHGTIAQDDGELIRRLLEVQKESYEEYPYPCIRAFHFACLKMYENPIYEQVLQAGKTDPEALLLDLGCCMGTDVRKLVRDGYPATQIVGCDLRQSYITSGYKLFNDKETCQIRFITSDVLALPADNIKGVTATLINEVSSLSDLTGQVKHLYTGALFHLFDEDTQFAIALRLVTLLKWSPGAIVFGRHQGYEVEGLIDDHMGRLRYAHSPSSWTAMWHKAFSAIEGETFSPDKIKVNAELNHGGLNGIPINNFAQLVWSVQIL